MGKQPVDTGYSWVICVGTGVHSFFVIGALKSMGVLFVELVEMFDAPRSVTALTLGFLAGGFAVFAMLTNAASVMFGFRPVIITGTLLLTLSIFMAQFPVNIWYMIMSMGLLNGIALAVMFTPSVHLLSLYFNKRRSFANGVSFAGSSIGQLTLPYLLTYLIDEYGYRGAMLIYTAISLHAFAAALLMRPVSFWGKDRENPKKIQETKSGEVLLDPGGEAENKELSNKSDGHKSEKENLLVKALSPKGSQHSIHSVHSNISGTPQSNHNVLGSVKSINSLQGSPVIRSRTNTLTLKPGPSVESLAILADATESQDLSPNKPQKKKFLCLKIRTVTCSEFCNLLFDPDLIKSPSLWIIFMALGLGHAGFINSILHLPVLAVELFHDKYTGAMLIAIAGVTDIVGRVGGGWFADLGYIRRVNLVAICFTITGSATILVACHPIFPLLVVFCLIMGLIGGIYRILLPVIVGDVFGPTKLGPGIGMLFMALGVLAVPIPSILGVMKNELGSYIPAFQLCGALLVFGACLLFTLPLVRSYDAAVVKDPPQIDEKIVEEA